MITVAVRRKNATQCGEVVLVRMHGHDRLTPKVARAALELAFGQGATGDVIQPEQRWGYRIYEHSCRVLDGEAVSLPADFEAAIIDSAEIDRLPQIAAKLNEVWRLVTEALREKRS